MEIKVEIISLCRIKNNKKLEMSYIIENKIIEKLENNAVQYVKHVFYIQCLYKYASCISCNRLKYDILFKIFMLLRGARGTRRARRGGAGAIRIGP